MTKRAIFFRGPPQSGKDLCATIANNFLLKHVKSQHCRFDQPFEDSVCRMLGLPHSAAYYLVDKNDTPCIEFFGSSPSMLFAEVLDAVQINTRPSVLGAAVARRIQRETQYDTFIFSDWPNDRAVLEVVNAVGPENCMIVSIDGRGDWSDVTEDDSCFLALNRCKTARIRNDDDREMLRLYVQGSVKGWLGLVDA